MSSTKFRPLVMAALCLVLPVDAVFVESASCREREFRTSLRSPSTKTGNQPDDVLAQLGATVRDFEAVLRTQSADQWRWLGRIIQSSNRKTASNPGRFVVLQDQHVADDGLISQRAWKPLKRLPHLKGVSLRNTRFTDAGLRQLSQLRQLQVLDLYGTAVTNAGLVDLQNMRQLSALVHLH